MEKATTRFASFSIIMDGGFFGSKKVPVYQS
jgi:hypothetical protein